MGVRIKETYEVYHENMAVWHPGLSIKKKKARIQLRYYWPSKEERRCWVTQTIWSEWETVETNTRRHTSMRRITIDIVGSVWQTEMETSTPWLNGEKL